MRNIMQRCARRNAITGGLVVVLSVVNTCAAQRQLPHALGQHPLFAQSTTAPASDDQSEMSLTGPNRPGKPGGVAGRATPLPPGRPGGVAGHSRKKSSKRSASQEQPSVRSTDGERDITGAAAGVSGEDPDAASSGTSAGWETPTVPAGVSASAPAVDRPSPTERARSSAAKADADARAAKEQARKAAQDAARAVNK